MFGIFKKKKDSYKSDVILMQNIFHSLPKDYEYIEKQLKAGLIIGSQKSDRPVSCYTKFSYNVELLNKLEDKKGRYFGIKGIYVLDVDTNTDVELQINIANGILISYFGVNVKKLNPFVDKIKTDNYNVIYFSEDDTIKNVLNAEEKKLVNIDDVYEVELKGKSYYHILDLEDGDFIGIDKDKKVYKITHNPFEIKLLDGSLISIIKNKIWEGI